MQLLGLAMPLSAAVILILCGIEGYAGVYVSRWVFWPFAIIFWAEVCFIRLPGSALISGIKLRCRNNQQGQSEESASYIPDIGNAVAPCGILRSSSMVQNNTGGCNLNHGASLIIGNDGAVALHLHSCVYLSR